MVRAIIQSYEVYEDLLAKTQKGVEFYGKLDSNVSRLLERMRSVYKIEQEERDKILERLAPKGKTKASNVMSANIGQQCEWLECLFDRSCMVLNHI